MTKTRIRIKELSAQGKLLLIGGLVVTSVNKIKKIKKIFLEVLGSLWAFCEQFGDFG